ncbi:MAG: DUF4167 domain-containing protein [Alphaproteobacteria bacterium]|nr:DUF4167 domain-containing protein [Alphaproteobacteria bacterium]
MKHNNSNRRSRGRGGNRRGGNNRAQVFDSNGPDVRIRGTAHQICEKYEALAKDARSAGDTVLAESYLQHAEHYQRIILSWNENSKPKQVQQTEEKSSKEEDLSLPGSILGDEVKVESTAAQNVQKKELEDA